MRSQSQLQRVLLDAACILSSAANIARRAALTIDVQCGQEDQMNKMTKSTNAIRDDHTIKSNDRKVYNKDQPNQSPPWPSVVLGNSSNSDLSSKIRERVSTRQNDEQRQKFVNESVKGADSRLTELAEQSFASITPDNEQRINSPESKDSRQHQGKEGNLGSHISFPPPELKSSSNKSSLPPKSEGTNLEPLQDEYDATKESKNMPLRSSKVPSSRIARLMHYGSLGAGLAWGVAGSYVRGESVGGKGKQFMSDDNVRRLVDKLSTMRGAALKLGQFMSIQDSNLLPEQIEQVMLRVQNSAHYMPQWQMEKVMTQDLGSDWRDRFEEFDNIPFASASIGQVHSAILSRKSSSPLAGQKIAVKVQFPGVRESIGSDLSNLRWLITASALLPKGLFLDNTIRVMKRELDDECDYEREKEMGKRFAELLNKPESLFAVPRIVDELCSRRILTTEMMKGRPLTQAARFTQEKRDAIAQAILELSLKELFSFRLMQTDPNWTNFLYNERTGKIELIDFGATREYEKAFMDDWLCMLRAAIGGDKEECIRWSEKVGYLTGEESKEMQNAHVESMIALGEPFRQDAPNPYPFEGQTITDRVRAQIPLMLRQRLTPPPEPTYSLNRKLSGAFLLCARLKAKVGCRELFENVTKDYVLGPNSSSGKTLNASNTLATNPSRPFQISHPRSFSTSISILSSTKRQRLGNLADRWPKHIVKAVKNTYLNEENKDEKFITLANDPVSPSTAGSTSLATDPAKVNLAAVPVGGQNVRSKDVALSPVNAIDENIPSPDSQIVIRGISIPRKPNPPGPEDCCMSGCARCVYDLYAEDLQDYQQDLSSARTKLFALSPPIANEDWDESIFGPKPKPQHETKVDIRSAEEKAQDEVDAVIGQLDPTMKAFLQLERSLKRKRKESN